MIANKHKQRRPVTLLAKFASFALARSCREDAGSVVEWSSRGSERGEAQRSRLRDLSPYPVSFRRRDYEPPGFITTVELTAGGPHMAWLPDCDCRSISSNPALTLMLWGSLTKPTGSVRVGQRGVLGEA